MTELLVFVVVIVDCWNGPLLDGYVYFGMDVRGLFTSVSFFFFHHQI